MEKIRFGYFLPFGPLENVIRQGMLAEKYGFDTIWFSDHLCGMSPTTICPEVWSTLAVLGLRTKRSMLASAVTDPLRRHPATTAQTVATLDRFLNGRIMLGIGAGEDMNLQPYGLDHPKVDRLREAIECIRLLWTSSSEKGVSYDGKYFRLKNAFLTIRPVQKPYPPIYVGALGPRTREVAGELADGWLPWIVYPAGFKEDVEDIKRGAYRAGRSLRQFDAVASVCVSVSNDVDAARMAVEQECREALVLERRTMNRLGFEIDLPSDVRIQRFVYSKKVAKDLEEATKRVPADAVDAISVYGTVDDCIGKIEEFVEAGATHFVVTNLGPDLEKTLRSFKEFIIPYFKKDHHS